ncbi:Oligoendopeptidase F, plasmid [bioreactor metagenome]|uniref:Oligoendopeptidase F, plasmid n=1 Tax=bioreactor metagenome TaxID=1076179 RepID=A0A645CMG5_9ZZZZ
MPCVIVNYTDDYNSLSTLAHELGHAIHDYLSSTNQASSYCNMATSFTAEIASLTNELLLARYMEDSAKTEDERLFYLMKEFDIYNVNFFGNLVTTDFEYEIRNVVNSGGVLTAQKLDDTFDRILHVYYPDSAAMKNRDVSWIYISQLYSPYYSKSYGFAVSAAANATDNILSGNKRAIYNYIDFLKAGSSRKPNELYALVGTSLTDPSFVQPFFDRCNKIIDESEAIIAKSAK